MNDTLPLLIDRLAAARIVVVGDAMLDVYTAGSTTRSMPESHHAAPVVLAESSAVFLGGAANVAASIAALGGAGDFICLTGNDAARGQMLALAAECGIPPGGFIADESRPTITKERIMANGIHVARVDREKTHDVGGAAAAALVACYRERLEGAGAVVLSDYCKGALSDAVIRMLIGAAADKNIPVLIDSKRKDLSIFKGAFLAKPNMTELGERVGEFNQSDEKDIERAARALMAQSGIENLIASRSERGMMFMTPAAAHSFPATARRVAEVSGAGDTALAVAALALAAGAKPEDAVWLANLGAGAAVEKDNTSTITADELKEAVCRSMDERKQA